MDFEWDDKKNAANIRKHCIDFQDVPKMFDYPILTRLDDRFDYGENRLVGVGILGEVVAVIVFVEKAQDTIRIISARKATTYEEKEYQKAIQD